MGLIERMKRRFQRKSRGQAEEMSQLSEEQFQEDALALEEEKTEFVRKKIKNKNLSIEDYCDQLVVSTRQVEQKKLEYEQVTAYLTDIQLIDQMTEEEKDNVQAVAFKLAALNTDREELKQENRSLTQLQFRFMQLHEFEIEDGIANMQEQESYQSDIRSDMQKLEQERVNLQYEEKYYLEKLHNIRMIAYSVFFLAVILGAITAFLYTQYVFDILFAGLIILFAAVVLGTILFVRYRNVNYALAYCKKQQSRAVTLMNKVRLKWVNNTATLDYMYSKYNVNSSRELSLLWEQYQKILDNEEKFIKSSKELTHYGDLLVKVLGNVGVHDPDIWINQPEALLDPREMVEVTHNLNARRQRLREDMDYDSDVMDMAISAIRDVIAKEPEQAVTVHRILEPYNISI